MSNNCIVHSLRKTRRHTYHQRIKYNVCIITLRPYEATWATWGLCFLWLCVGPIHWRNVPTPQLRSRGFTIFTRKFAYAVCRHCLAPTPKLRKRFFWARRFWSFWPIVSAIFSDTCAIYLASPRMSAKLVSNEQRFHQLGLLNFQRFLTQHLEQWQALMARY